MKFIENEGALFRGASVGFPSEVWNAAKGAFEPYKGTVPKPIEWGNEIDENEANEMMGQ